MAAAAGFQMLRDAGLVMQATFSLDALPDWAISPMTSAAVDVAGYQTLVLLGQAGRRFWEFIQEAGPESQDPFDDVSRQLAATFVVDHLGDPPWKVVYPSSLPLPLGRYAELAGWGRASPLGLTINDEYGLWLAHRVAFLVDVPLPATEPPRFSHPCDSCIDRPCLAACPAGAVSLESGFDVAACASFRVEPRSVCADQCLARMACPVGADHRYGPAQVAHHYASGLASIRRYLDSV